MAVRNHFDAIRLVGKDATSNNLLDTLKKYASRSNSGDSLFISYSGHGTRVKDLNKDEDDGYDEALVLYDRLFIDDEFQLCWTKFRQGVKIFFVNDSCYNGTVSRLIQLHKKMTESIYPNHILRGIDTSQSSIDFQENISFYKNIKLGSDDKVVKALCSVIHLAACQDNQLADDGATTDTKMRLQLNGTGVGMSTLTKFLYFFEMRLQGLRCVILDDRIADVLNAGKFEELSDLKKVTRNNKGNHYLEYLELLDSVSKSEVAKT
jgi:hypothetical protein